MDVNVQYALPSSGLPSAAQFEHWARAALTTGRRKDAELTVRIVDAEEGAQLNQSYRQGVGSTNVLSFPFEPPAQIESLPMQTYLGDLVICAPVVLGEAREQHKLVEAHWAHLVVHGVLHLLGYDHMDDNEAEIMERLEIQILAQFGYPDPYLETQPA